MSVVSSFLILPFLSYPHPDPPWYFTRLYLNKDSMFLKFPDLLRDIKMTGREGYLVAITWFPLASVFRVMIDVQDERGTLAVALVKWWLHLIFC